MYVEMNKVKYDNKGDYDYTISSVTKEFENENEALKFINKYMEKNEEYFFYKTKSDQSNNNDYKSIHSNDILEFNYEHFENEYEETLEYIKSIVVQNANPKQFEDKLTLRLYVDSYIDEKYSYMLEKEKDTLAKEVVEQYYLLKED